VFILFFPEMIIRYHYSPFAKNQYRNIYPIFFDRVYKQITADSKARQ